MKNNQISQKRTDEVGINIRQLLKRSLKFWYVFILFPLVMSIIAWIYLQYQVPVYEVKSSILIKDEKNKQGISATDIISKEFGGLTNNKKMLVDESKIMTSYNVIEKVVRDLKLDRTVLLKEAIKNKEIYGEDCPILIDSFALRDTVTDFKASLEIVGDNRFELTTADGNKQTNTFGSGFGNKYGYFLINKSNSSKYADEKRWNIVCKGVEKTARDIIKTINIVLPKKESNIMEPTIQTTVPEKAKDILQKMVDVYNEFNLKDNREVSQNTLTFIEKRLMALTNELSGVEKNVETYKTREGITADGSSDIAYSFNKLGEYDTELVKLEVQNSILASIEEVLTKTDPSFDLLPTNLELKSSSLQSQIGDYNKLVLERNRLAKVAGDYNPTLKNLTLEIIGFKRAIIENIRRVKQENTSLLNRAQSKNTQFAYKLSKAPRNERELTDIKRQQSIKEGIYLFLLQKQEETAISLIGAVSDARIIDRPIIGETPISAKKSIFYLIGISFGLFLGFIYVIFKGLVDDTVQSEADIVIKTSMPILAKIPYSKAENNWVVQSGSHSLIAEMFRNLRSNLQYVLPLFSQNNKGQVILITSTTSDEGKRFITLNLGMGLALANKRTVILSLDLRNPKLSSNFPLLKNAVGITNYLTTDLYPHEIIQPSGKYKDLFYINGGEVPHNPSELLMSPKMGLLFAYLKDNFDYIIVNTPPIGLVSDALSLKPYVDMTLFVVRLGFTKKEDINIIQEFYEVPKLPNPTIVLNGIKWDEKGRHSYYGNDIVAEKKTSRRTESIFTGNWIKEKLL